MDIQLRLITKITQTLRKTILNTDGLEMEMMEK